MTQKIQFKIVTPEATVYENEIDQATLPCISGQVTILPGHRSYIAALQAGELMLKKNGEEIHLAVSGGFVEFVNNTLVVLADTAERAEAIDIKRAEEARQRAEDLKKEKVSVSEMEYAKVAAAIEREAVRIRVAKKHHTRRGLHIENDEQ
ncbi:MAG: ATP synthase epsilon chain [Candidatus Wolfebacteria bacterium GW2011_GWC2_39_22]|uniref:ATP synthase epsilon chain n=2 Tax=Candidatus Wolfeibacteriota TaxID=1752735 RepID=A0A0G1JI13_9BACT|nr:MAG: ATP synthase epsilon chain [Candidatus Wolfebacteria bacterium GW2011_GWC2_39_22]KKT43607.1 MAG: ATP synthase epsilon chain [Candidatus Wolfebacteria bacterium GW2011_GWE2_44_13]HBI25663.1 F0F1 ATP synthase subunit epsilon [Candidatus Wolfebacteria bacterium]